MKVKILMAKEPEALEKLVNEFIASKQVFSVSFEIGAFPGFAEFYAMITYHS